MDIILYSKNENGLLSLKHIGNGKDASKLCQKLTKDGFVPTNLSSSLQLFDYADVVGAKAYIVNKKLVDDMENIVSLSDVSMDALINFSDENPYQNNFLLSDDIDMDVTQVFFDESDTKHIRGILYACSDGKSNVYFPSSYTEKQNDYKNIIPLLIIAAVSKAEAIYGRGKYVAFEPSRAEGANGFNRIFGKAVSKAQICEYVKYVSDDSFREMIKKISDYNEKRLNDNRNDAAFYDIVCYKSAACPADISTQNTGYLAKDNIIPDDAVQKYLKMLLDKYIEWNIAADTELPRIYLNISELRGNGRIFKEEFPRFFRDAECERIYLDFCRGNKAAEQIKESSYDDIKYYESDITEKKLFDILPSILREITDKEEYKVICAVNSENVLLGVAIIHIPDITVEASYGRLPAAELVFMECEHSAKESMLKTELVKRSAKLAAESGMVYFSFRDYRGDLEDACGAADETGSDFLMTYNLIELDLKSLPKGSKTIGPQECRLSPAAFLAEGISNEQNIAFDIEKYDTQRQIFALSHNKVVGLLYAKRISVNDTLVYDSWVSKDHIDEDLVGKMLGALIKKIVETSITNQVLVVRVKDMDTADTFRSALGKENTLCRVRTYSYDISGMDLSEGESVSDEDIPDIDVTRVFYLKLSEGYERFMQGRDNEAWYSSVMMQC